MSENPYDPPASQLTDGSAPLTKQHGRLAISVLLPTGVALTALLIVPDVASEYATFNYPTYLSTRVVFATYRWWGISPVTVAVLWPIVPPRSRRALFVFGVTAAVGLLVLLVAVFPANVHEITRDGEGAWALFLRGAEQIVFFAAVWGAGFGPLRFVAR